MPESKKVIVKLELHGEKERSKALKSVSGLSGIESLSMDMKERKMTIIGEVNPVEIAGKLKKWYPEILTIGPAKEEKKAEDPKKKAKEEAIKKWVEDCYDACSSYQQYCNCSTCSSRSC